VCMCVRLVDLQILNIVTMNKLSKNVAMVFALRR
jgi:hypothetical protein